MWRKRKHFSYETNTRRVFSPSGKGGQEREAVDASNPSSPLTTRSVSTSIFLHPASAHLSFSFLYPCLCSPCDCDLVLPFLPLADRAHGALKLTLTTRLPRASSTMPARTRQGPSVTTEVVDTEETSGNLRRLKFNEPLTWRVGRAAIPIADLLQRLQTLAQELRKLEQEEVEKESLKKVSQELATPQLLGHKDKGVRAWTTCCIVDVLRLCAPDAPFTGNQLKVRPIVPRQIGENHQGPLKCTDVLGE